LEGKEVGRGSAWTATSPSLCSDLQLVLALLGERERRAALPRLEVRWRGEWSGVGSEGLGWGVL
jgi:hypothetical protein